MASVRHSSSVSGSSPHTRGARGGVLVDFADSGIIPAYAGSTPSATSGSANTRDHPRIRGEHLLVKVRGKIPRGSSPHTRGAPGEVAHRETRRRIIPAYAGSTGLSAGGARVDGDHPRIRGEHVTSRKAIPSGAGSSPHTRGARASVGDTGVEMRIIPAYAGSTLYEVYCYREIGDHPRIRGEHRRWPARRIRLLWIIPAYAGSTSLWSAPSSRAPDHPRIRGEHSRNCDSPRASVGSSPHTRGALEKLPSAMARFRIIPAYAGSTLGNPCNTKDRRRDYTSFPLPVTHPSGGGGS